MGVAKVGIEAANLVDQLAVGGDLLNTDLLQAALHVLPEPDSGEPFAHCRRHEERVFFGTQGLGVQVVEQVHADVSHQLALGASGELKQPTIPLTAPEVCVVRIHWHTCTVGLRLCVVRYMQWVDLFFNVGEALYLKCQPLIGCWLELAGIVGPVRVALTALAIALASSNVSVFPMYWLNAMLS